MQNLFFLLLLILTNLATYTFFEKDHKGVLATDDQVVTASALVKPKPLWLEKESTTLEQNSEAGVITLNELGDILLVMEDSPLKESLLKVFTAGWFEMDHISLAEWLNNLDVDINADVPTATFANMASEIDPEGAVDWAASVMEPVLREQVLRRTVLDFSQYDPDRFEEFLARGDSTARAVISSGLINSYQNDSTMPYRYDIIEEQPESSEVILARRTRLAGSSSRENKVNLTLE
jgi:hypothetical protein